jgi:hypothetical protein
MPRNPFQDRINALNMKDLEEGLKTDSFLKKSHGPIPNDVNDLVFPYTDIKRVDTLKPEELSMKDLLDQIQIQTILNNNIAPYVKKEIKSEVTQEMIKDFQNESAKPVEINGTLYKFKPPDVNIDLIDVPPPFPDEATYKNHIYAVAEQELKTSADIERRRIQVENAGRKLVEDYNAGRVNGDEFRKAHAHYDNIRQQLEDAFTINQVTLASLQKDHDSYEELRLQHVADVERITKENKKSLTNYADEIKSRNSGFELPQQEGESDADYAQRMIDTAHTVVDPNQALIQAQLYLYSTMKDRLSEMIQPYKAEGVLNQIVKVDGYEGLQVVKDRWPSLKKGLTDTFGDLRRVDNTNSIAIFLLENSPVSAKVPMVAPASAPRAVPAPNVFPSPPSVPSYTVTNAPKVKPHFTKYNPSPIQLVPDKASMARTAFDEPPEVPTMYARSNPKPRLTPQELFPKQGAKSLEEQYKDMGGKKMIPYSQISNTELVDVLRQFGIKPYTQGKLEDVKSKNYDLAVKSGISIQPNPEAPPKRPQHKPVLSNDLKEQLRQSSKNSSKLPINLITNDDLVALLAHHGLPYLVGHSKESKEKNYAQAISSNLIPDRPALEPRSAIEKMKTKDLKQYLESKGVRGSNGGLPSKATSRDSLMKMYDHYATPELRASGLKPLDIKSQFEIINGEIEAGNNNPQLLRDARKLLKEFVQKKMVTIYEAKTHMKHLRKVNKI